MNKVSVIIPIYNTENYLTECLTSVTNQTYKNLEIVLINDSSNDASKELITEWRKKDSRITVYNMESRIGVGAARNYGVQQSNGEYVYFMDSDDYIAENVIEELVSNIKNKPLIKGKIFSTHMSNQRSIDETESVIKDLNTTKAFKNITILNTLIKKSYIDQHNLLFSENVELYSEMKFILRLINELYTIPYLKHCIYFKRLRNDPISNPSLLQKGLLLEIKDYLTAFIEERDKYNNTPLVYKYLDKHFLNFYRKKCVLCFREPQNIKQVFSLLSNAALKIFIVELKRKDYILKREINALIKGDVNKYYTINKTHQRLRRFKIALSGRTKMKIFLYQVLFMKLPLKENTIVFESFLGKNYSDSPKYIYEYIINEKLNYKCIWIFNKTGKDISGNAKQIKRVSLRYYYYLATSKYWISNSRMPLRLQKRQGNVYLQTWHGTPLKHLVFDMEDVHSANPNYKSDFYKQSRRWDYLISPNDYSSEIFRRAFKYEKELLEYGYPRNDILYKEEKEIQTINLKTTLKLPLDKKVILYAPTWRDDEFYDRGKYKFNLELDLDKMKKLLGEEYIIILRMHYFIANKLDISKFHGFAYDYSSYDDIAELYLISDILITDYSSVFFDFGNLRRPILFFTYDLEKYRDTLRGFYFDIEKEAPGPLLKNSDEVIDAILNIEEIKRDYHDRYEKFYQKFCDWDDGKATKNVVEHIFN